MKQKPINPITHCYSSRSKTTLALAAIAEDTEYINAVADSAATGHFLPNKDNKQNNHEEIQVICANSQTMTSVATTKLDIPEVSEKAKTAFHFNEMDTPLLSIPVLADDGCKIALTKDNIVVTKNDQDNIKRN